MWAPHGQHRWYIGPAPEHYRCYQIYIPKTQGTRICDTVEFFPTHCKLPNVSAHDAAIYAANDLITALTKPQPPNSFILVGDEQIVALQKLANIFQTSITKQPISALGVPDSAPPNRPRTHSQTNKFANAALTPPQGTKLLQTQPKQPINQQKEWDPFPDPPPPPPPEHHSPLQTTHCPDYSQLSTKYIMKHEGLLEDPFPLIH